MKIVDVDVPASNVNTNSGLSELEQFEAGLEQENKGGDGGEEPGDFEGALC